jgi:glycosyltransferase involved in cell wall biosynthesis
MQWFLGEVWPIIRKQVPHARFTMVGFNPIPEIRRLAETGGVTLMADVPDLRETARRHAVLALPFVSGGGAKNKLLEGAALGMPIVCSPLATQGLLGLESAPLRVATHPEEFAKAIISLWNDETARRRDGSALRAWVVKHHSWTASGQAALNSLK